LFLGSLREAPIRSDPQSVAAYDGKPVAEYVCKIMANPDHVKLLMKNTWEWNEHHASSKDRADFEFADLSKAKLLEAKPRQGSPVSRANR
jgi:hypothetical protein